MAEKYWQMKAKSFTSRAEHLFNSSIHTDCEFIVENDIIRCHKLILAMSSPVFEAMFFGSMPESDSVTLKDVKADSFRALMRLIYGSQLPLNSVEEACELYIEAKKYLIRFVVKSCVDYLTEHVSEGNVLQLLGFAEFHGEGDLERKCLEEITCKGENVLAQESLVHADEAILHSVLDLSRLNVESEVHVFRAVEKWLKTRQDLKPEVQRKMIRKIRFLSFTLDEFIADVAPSDFLTDKDKFEILMRLVKPDLPDIGSDLCSEKWKRKTCARVSTAILRFQEIMEIKCHETEWAMSTFRTSKSFDLMGVEVFLQTNNVAEGEYDEKLLVQVSLANERRCIIAEGRLYRTVPYNSHKQIFFKLTPTLEPETNYSIHVHMFQKGTYRFGLHSSLECKILEQGGEKKADGDEKEVENVQISFIDHVSNTFPVNCTNLFGLILTDPFIPEV